MTQLRQGWRRLPQGLGALLLAGAWSMAGAAQVVSFGEAFEAALAHDAQMQAARHERESAQQAVPIARAGLLPSVALNVSQTQVRGVREFPNSQDQQVRQDLDYKAPYRSLQLRMPLFNYEALSRYRQSLAQHDQADELFRVRGNDLLDRLGTAYLQRLLAEENVRLWQAQVAAVEAQRERALRLMERGEATRIEVAETEAALDVARVQLIEAQNEVLLARRALMKITGTDLPGLRDVTPDYEPVMFGPGDLASWQALAAERNPVLRARERAVEAARLAIHRAQSGHLPKLDLVASATMSRNESLSTLSQESRLHSVGLQLSVPLYSGGGVSATVRQAAADRARFEAELEAERQAVALEIQKYFQAVVNGAAKVEAYRKALVSSQVALEGMQKSMTAGYRTNADVLDAQSKVYTARRDLARARYDYLVARMRLQLQAGATLDEIVADIDAQLARVPHDDAAQPR
jgi:protease secretion system outer membrane protein